MKRFKRVDSLETVVNGGTEDSHFNIQIKRVIPPTDGSTPSMLVDVYVASEDGSYDGADARVIKIREIDTLDIQYLLIELKQMIATLTGVHVQE